jgi:hypothetical protein
MPNDGVDIGSYQTIYRQLYSKLVEAKKLSLDDDFTKYLKFDTKGRKSPLLNYLTTPLGWKLICEEIEFFDMLTNQGLPHNSIAKNV